MAEIAALRERARSVKQTLKITNAMYLLSQAKSRKVRAQLESVLPFFDQIYNTVGDVLRHSTEVKHPFFGAPRNGADGQGHVGLVVLTGDKGLAGAYNHNVIDAALTKASGYGSAKFYVVGEMGRHMLAQKGIRPEREFEYPAADPTLSRAWEMSRRLVQLFKEARLREIWLVYTHVVSPLAVEPTLFPLLPLDPNNPFWSGRGERRDNRLAYEPNVDAVISRLVPVFLAGALYGAMVEAFCSENSSRMNAMKTATENGQDMLARLTLRYNRLRQDAITAQIIEVAGGFNATE